MSSNQIEENKDENSDEETKESFSDLQKEIQKQFNLKQKEIDIKRNRLENLQTKFGELNANAIKVMNNEIKA